MDHRLEHAAAGTRTTSAWSYANDCMRRQVTWTDAMLMASLCDDVDMTSNPVRDDVDAMTQWNWRVVPLVLLVAAGIVGNTLVCASVAIERRLHSVTNYFLVSLAVADLFVSLVVMPCCIVQEFIGQSAFYLLT